MRVVHGHFWLSSGDLPCSSSSASETVVIDRVDVFLDFGAVYLCVVGDGDQPSGLPLGRGAIGFPRRARNWRTWTHLEWSLQPFECWMLFSQ